MADGDVLRLGIPGAYAKAYRPICAGSGAPEEWARKQAEGIKHYLTKYGDEPRQLVQTIASMLAPLAQCPDQIDRATCVALDREISRLQRTMAGHKQGMSLAASACSSLLRDLEQGVRIADLSGELARRFVARVHSATFVARVEAAPHHLDNADRATVQARLEASRPAVESYIDSMARQWLCPPDNAGLRLPPRPRPAVDNDTVFE